MAWRYMAQRATTGVWLDRQVPFLRRDTSSTSLNAAGRFSGVVSPDYGTKKAADGMLLFERDATILWALNGSKHYAYLLDGSEWVDNEWRITGTSIAGYPFGVIFNANYHGVKVDPADIYRAIWDHLQSYPDGDFGVRVVGTTPIRVGTDSDDKAAVAAAAYDTANNAYKAAKDELARLRKIVAASRATLSPLKKTRSAQSKALTARKTQVTAAKRALTAAQKTKNAAKIADAQRDLNAANAAQADAQAALNQTDLVIRTRNNTIKSQQADVDAQSKVVDIRQASKDKAQDAKSAADDKARDDGGAYKILWPDNPDCGNEINTLTETTPFDWTEESHVNGDDTSHVITLHYPRAGRHRTDLRFVQGENIMARAEPKDLSDDFANEWIGIGAGEGSGSIHRTAAVRDGHVRRPKVLSQKDITSNSIMDRKLAARLKASRNVIVIPSIVVRDHPNARIASWDVGDDIDVQVNVQFLGKLNIRHRIVSWSPLDDTTARLTLQRSDSFLYGG
jgi:hypothetical protein